MSTEKVGLILLGTSVGGFFVALSIPNDYRGYALGGVFWLTTAVYGWLYRRPRRLP